MSNSDDKILARVRALLEKARNVAGTPEADTYNEKAFELIAKYGIDESEARTSASIQSDKLMAVKFRLGSTYTAQRIELLRGIATALHCAGILLDANTVQVWGVGRHIERVKLLHDLLAVQMVAGVSRVECEGVNVFAHDARERRSALTSLRTAHMDGYAAAIHKKLTEIEEAAARQHDRNNPHRDYQVALQSDAQRARNAMCKRYPNRVSYKGDRAAGSDYAAARRAGYQQGMNTDLGQTRVGGGRMALT